MGVMWVMRECGCHVGVVCVSFGCCVGVIWV